jgi:hypothetical protein
MVDCPQATFPQNRTAEATHTASALVKHVFIVCTKKLVEQTVQPPKPTNIQIKEPAYRWGNSIIPANWREDAWM